MLYFFGGVLLVNLGRIQLEVLYYRIDPFVVIHYRCLYGYKLCTHLSAHECLRSVHKVVRRFQKPDFSTLINGGALPTFILIGVQCFLLFTFDSVGYDIDFVRLYLALFFCFYVSFWRHLGVIPVDFGCSNRTLVAHWDYDSFKLMCDLGFNLWFMVCVKLC